MAEKPGNPSEGKVDAEKVEAEAAEAKAAASVEGAQEQAEAAPKKPRARRTGKPKAEAKAPAGEELTDEVTEGEPEGDATATVADEKAEAKPKPARKPRAKKPAEPKAEDKPAAKPAPTRRGRREAPERVVVRAQAKYVRTSARKARLVCDHLRGKDVPEARAILLHTNRQVAEAWTKLLESAVANAAENHSLDGEDLRIAFVSADEGPTLKRFRPRAMGRATKIRKRTSHLSIGLEPKE